MSIDRDFLQSLVRSLPDIPRKGVIFRDVTTLFKDPRGLNQTVEMMVQPYLDHEIDKVAGVEARGFILGGAIANKLCCGFVPVRKQGKLPWNTIGQDYELEYGRGRIEIHTDGIEKGEHVLLVDDLVATGGTTMAVITLLERMGADIVGCSYAVDLPDLGGSKLIGDSGYSVTAVMEFRRS